MIGPVTPTMTKGWQARMAKTMAPSTEAKRTSLTPYCIPVLVNMSSENARAGIILYSVSQHQFIIVQATYLIVKKKKLLGPARL